MTIRAITFLVLLLIGSRSSARLHASENCDMAAMISRATLSTAQLTDRPGRFDDPNDFFDFLIERSTSGTNPDGYGIVCAGSDGLFPNPRSTSGESEFYFSRGWYVKALDTAANAYHYSHYPGPMEAARSAIARADSEATVVLGHVRSASSSAVGSHPFRFQYGDTVYTFMHNGSVEGGIKSALYEALGGAAWFEQHPPNWTDGYDNVANLVDTEVLFHWIMSRILAHKDDVFKGALEALTASVGDYELKSEFQQDYVNNTINFVLSDGEALYLFRNSRDPGPRLSWAEPQAGFFMVKTQDELQNPLDQFAFVAIPRYGQPNVLDRFLDHDPAHFVSNRVGSTTWNGTVYITDDTVVPMEVTLVVGGRVQFINRAQFVINGTLNLHADAQIYLANDSTILVEDCPAALGLTWGSKITCAPAGTDRAAPSGDCAVGEKLDWGDCVIARNGGVVATRLNPPLLPCSPLPREYQRWRDYCRLWTLSRLLRHCSCYDSQSGISR